MTAARGGTLTVEVEGTTVDGTGTRGTIGCEAILDGEVGLDALEEREHGWSPFDECEAVKHGQHTDIDTIVLGLSV